MFRIHKECALSSTIAAACLLLGACNSGADVTVTSAEEEPVLQCGVDGFLAADLYGAVEARLDWTQNDLECTGMPRPEGRGVRLRLAGPEPGSGAELVFIIALPEFDRDSAPAEFDANVTLIESGVGRFFSTPDTSNCLVARPGFGAWVPVAPGSVGPASEWTPTKASPITARKRAVRNATHSRPGICTG